MDHKTNLLIAFVIAVAVHAGAGVYVNHLLSGQGDTLPDFKSGGYSVSLILSQPRQTAAAPQPVKAPAVPTPPAPPVVAPTPMPVAHNEPAPAAEPTPSEPEPPAATEQPSNETAANQNHDASTDSDAAAGEQGVETMYVGLSDIRPHYPLGSRMRGEEGVVSITASIGFTGHASDVEVSRSSGYPALDREAVDAVKKATFVARNASATSGDKITLSFRFKLTD